MSFGFRMAVRQAGQTAHRVYATTRQVVSNVDRGLGHAARLYRTMAPVLAPLANELLGHQRASATNKAIQQAMNQYGNVRTKVLEAHRMGDALTGMVKKEFPGLQI